VAILADQDEEALRQVASLRQPGGSGLAVVLDTPTFADGTRRGSHTSRAGRSTGSQRGPGPAATAYAELLHTAGWSVAVAEQGDPVPNAWSALTTRGVLVG
jgi:hypothetical protein